MRQCKCGLGAVHFSRSLFLFALAVLMLVSGVLPAKAEESGATDSLPNRLMIRGGWAYVFNADTTIAINGSAGLGTVVDVSRSLHMQREDNAWRIDSLYRFNPTHSIGFGYYDVTRKGNAQLAQNITIDDTTYAVGSQLTSKLDIGLYRFFYNYSFHHDDKVELGASVGLYFADIETAFSGSFICTGGPSCTGTVQGAFTEKSTLLAPLPSLGFLVNYNFTPRLLGQGRFDWFYVDSNQFKGAMNELYIGLEYRLFDHFAVGAAYNRLDLNLNYQPDRSTGWQIRNDWNMVYLFGSLYFHEFLIEL